jgi:hypothetical protein
MAGDRAPLLAGLLLVTAAWTLLSGTDEAQLRPTVDAGRWWPARGTLEVQVGEAGLRMWYADEPELVMAGRDATARLGEAVAALRRHLPSAQPIRIRAADRVGYGRVVEVLDVFLDQGFSQLSVGSAGG